MLKEIDMAGALARLKDGSDQICAIIPVTKETTLNELMNARGFVLVDGRTSEERVAKPRTGTNVPAPKKVPSVPPKKAEKVDHGKIIALHNAGWTATAIASEVGCSIPTVTSHIKAEKEKGE